MIGLGISVGLDVARRSVVAPVDPIVNRLITNVLAPGNDGAALTAGTNGAVRSSNLPYVNRANTAVTEIALVFSGWRHVQNAADELCPMDYAPAWTIEYPVGSAVQNGVAPTVTPGSNTVTEFLTLNTPIPAGATFNVAVSLTEATGQRIPQTRDSVNTRFTPHGIITRKPSSEIPLAMGFFGDSIWTNSDLPPTYAAKAAGLPSIQLSIIGTTGYQQIGNLTRRLDLYQKCGVTHIATNYLANDLSAGRSVATIQGDIETLAAAWKAIGANVLWSTALPRVENTSPSRTITSLTQSGGVATAIVSGDVSLFEPGMLLSISGATEAGYNGVVKILSVNGQTVTCVVDQTVASPATGAPVFSLAASVYTRFQVPVAGAYANGNWAIINDWVRTSPGSIDDHIELADAFTPARNDCRWITGGDYVHTRYRRIKPSMTVSSIVNTSRFAFSDDGDSYPLEWCVGGTVQWLTGNNVGRRSTISSVPATRNIQLSAAPTGLIQVGDTFAVRPTNQARPYSDGLHPDLNGSWSGVWVLRDALTAKFNAMRAAL